MAFTASGSPRARVVPGSPETETLVLRYPFEDEPPRLFCRGHEVGVEAVAFQGMDTSFTHFSPNQLW